MGRTICRISKPLTVFFAPDKCAACSPGGPLANTHVMLALIRGDVTVTMISQRRESGVGVVPAGTGFAFNSSFRAGERLRARDAGGRVSPQHLSAGLVPLASRCEQAGCRSWFPRRNSEQTEHGLVPEGDGWYVVNMRDAAWRHVDGRGAVALVADDFENIRRFEQLGVNPFVIQPGEPMSLYHWETDQEDLLVVSGEAVLIVEGEERAAARVGFRAPAAQHQARGHRCRQRVRAS